MYSTISYPGLVERIMEKIYPCAVCHCLFDENILFPLGLLHEDIHTSLRSAGIMCTPDGHICRPDLSQHTPLLDTHSDLSSGDDCRMFANQTDIENICTFSDRCSDLLTACMGSWSFLIWSFVFFILWILSNSYWKPVDPYPFIFLNLILSVVSALQAPVILMSQNRQAECDRARSTYDYAIDLKAELGIRKNHEKLDMILQKIKEINNPPKTP
jgi:uncharacterized membrane protein